MSKRGRKVCFLILTGVAIALAGCATQPPVGSHEMPGFIGGLIHGVLMPFSFIGSFFMDVRIYNFPNAGKWYDFGYLVGAMIIFGGSGGAARR